MNADLRATLHGQLYGNSFDFLSQKLGAELVESIPTVVLLSEDEEFHPRPWKNPEDLPADAIKGIFSKTGRPFLAIRYFDVKVNKLAIEVFFQLYSSKPTMTKYHDFDQKDSSWKWTSTVLRGDGISSNALMGNREFEIVKNLLLGTSLKSTNGRYLPHREVKPDEVKNLVVTSVYATYGTRAI